MSNIDLEQLRLFELEFTKEQIPPEDIIRKRVETFTGLIPITICSFRKRNTEKAKPAELYTCKRIKAFREQFKDQNHIILSKKYGLMFSDQEYTQYEDKEQLADRDLIYLLRKQNELYPDLKLAYYNPRPLTGTKWVNILRNAGFAVIQFKTLSNYENIEEEYYIK
jgi:hypothetical protein